MAGERQGLVKKRLAVSSYRFAMVDQLLAHNTPPDCRKRSHEEMALVRLVFAVAPASAALTSFLVPALAFPSPGLRMAYKNSNEGY